MEPLAVLLMCAGLIALYAFRPIIGVPSSHSLLPFQSGVLFRRGLPIREVGPGRHRVFLGKERIIFLDTRPIDVTVENRAVALADGEAAVYGFAARAQVRDVKKALYASAAYSQLPAFVLLCAVRAGLNRRRTGEITVGQMALTEDITVECRSRLAMKGFELISFRFTRLEVVTPSSAGSVIGA